MPNNLLLNSLSKQELDSLDPYLERTGLRLHQEIVEPHQYIDYVYFPIDCMISLVTMLEDGRIIESATIGNEGMSGLSAFHGLERSPAGATVQLPGEAVRMKTSDLRALLPQSPGLVTALGRYADALISMLAQLGACNGLHSVDQRFARWLLTIQDRVGKDEFFITQEFLAHMLGSYRPTVTVAAGTLQKAGFITYRHGQIKVMDRASLEDVACECYAIIRDLYSLTFKAELATIDKVSTN